MKTYRTDAAPSDLDHDRDADLVTGTNGADQIVTGGGPQYIMSGNQSDHVAAGGGPDTVEAGNGKDVILGQGGPDTLFGGNGKDVLVGGCGPDVLAGGRGADRFVYAAESQAPAHGGGGDGCEAGGRMETIVDFQPGLDTLDLSALAAFSFATGPAAHAVWVEEHADGAIVMVDTDGRLGPEGADMAVVLAGVDPFELAARDFALADLLALG